MANKALKVIHWYGDSLNVIREFPRAVRVDIGSELYLLQLGDRSGAFRAFYVLRRRDGIHVLHAFRKKTQKTRRSDIELAKSRYQDLHRKR